MYWCACDPEEFEKLDDCFTADNAWDGEDAAEAFAEYCWDWDDRDAWEWMKNGADIYVRSEDGNVTKYEVSVDWTPNFRAYKAST